MMASNQVPDSAPIDHAMFFIFTFEENNGLQGFFWPIAVLMRNEAGFSQGINLRDCFEGSVRVGGQAQLLLLCELCSLPN